MMRTRIGKGRAALLAALLGTGGWAAGQTAGTVATSQGPVQGVTKGAVTQYLGLPYAAPPTGPNRWRPPQAGPTWTAPRAADQLGSACAQVISALFAGPGEQVGDVKGQEDCLFLNVYVPQGRAGPLPVMVWIHGGAFVNGSGGAYDASELARREGVIVVTLNYRLGPLGFLSLPELDAESTDGTSGNYGFMDQQAALRWVQANIAAFGGDRQNVTLFGQSAGGYSICTHLASPGSAGLFQKAVIMSGLCGSPGNTVSASEAAQRNVAYAARLGCRKDTLACLRTLDPARLASIKVPGVRPLSNLVWAPVYGGEVLPRPLLETFQNGVFNKVPVVAGTTRDEGRLFVKVGVPEGRTMSLPLYWGAAGLLTGAPNVTRALREYPGRGEGTPALAFSNLFTDAVFACPAVNVAGALARFVPVYAYEFADPQAATEIPSPPDLPGMGSAHSAELVYLFRTRLPGLGNPAAFTPAQARLADAFAGSFGAFARTRQPGWTAYDAARGNVQVFTPSGNAPSTTFAQDHRCDFWNGLKLP
ncbi:carboxylesterase family protein [Deinococcus soli (ex Cha et al. 2016)]|uniref:Para-nitrobenzyl esterase n=2 Tax=Deinococcus soli (ex Cha et al. 2016) TaxID=1309411 RepID=A0ACC6KBN1_9DEIO|nr:carboxylesterase family protein [Deinococcus soli (ex Cha et al. 2016)]MDR6216766.1 para-nitrobenzyl esterase [Deinococcus soli (ex Cha et al. 2016)]MDR6327587.1 para-nitrobenzyl esterase [Deinococcus soli (ex Cha et al. 2016)]MDR6749862.1 para-nitrobenzyl esterase [Deinococcus soli (ex Cha et al. 2016)]